MGFTSFYPIGVHNKIRFGEDSPSQRKTPAYYENLKFEDFAGRKTHPRFYEIMNEPWMRKIHGLMRHELLKEQFDAEGWDKLPSKWEMPLTLDKKMDLYPVSIEIKASTPEQMSEVLKKIGQVEGVILSSTWGNITTALLPANFEKIKQIAVMPDVLTIEQSRTSGSLES